MNDTYKILHLQNVATAAELTERELRKGNIKFDHYIVNNEQAYLKALNEYKPDIILCDHSTANFNHSGALEIFKGLNLNIPFILLAVNRTDETAINFLKEGVDDFVMNDNLQRLPIAIERAIRRHRLQSERRVLKTQLADKEKATAKYLSDLTGKFSLATKTAGIGIWQYSFEDNNIDADDILLSHFGLKGSDFNGGYDTLRHYIFPADYQNISEDISLAINKRTDVCVEYRVTWNDGTIHHLKTTAHLQCDEFDKPCRLIGTSQDITESKKAEQQLSNTSHALQKALNDLKKILDSSLDVIFSLDEKGTFINVSAASVKIWGYTPTELIGKLYSSFVFQNDQSKTAQAFADVTAGVNITNFENYFVCKDGSLVPIVLSARWDATENILYCIAREATEKKLADAQLLLSEQRFKDLVQGGSDLIVILNQEGTYLYVSPNSMDVLGFAAEEFIGKNTFTFMHPDDVELAMKSFSQIAHQKKIAVPPIRFLHKDGSWRWLDSSVTNFIDNPSINGIVINARDVTDRKLAQNKIEESEAKYRAFFENSIDGILLTANDGEILAANPSACKMFGMTEAEVSATGRDGLIDRSDPRAEKLIQLRQQTGKAKGELTFLRKDGTTFPGEVTSGSFKDVQGNERTSLIIRDITEQKRAADTIKASEAFSSGVLDSLTSRIAVINSSGIIIKVNKTWNTFALENGATSLSKFSEGANYFDACENATDDESAPFILKGIRNVLDGSLQEFYFEYPCHSPSEKRWFYMRVRKFEGSEPLVLIEHQDITERVKSEEKLIAASETLQHTLKDLNNVMDSSLDIICVLDVDGTFVKISAAAEQTWGYKPDELIGVNSMKLVFKEDVKATLAMNESIINGFPVTIFENRYIHKNGNIVPMLWSARWDVNSNLMYCIAKDATEKKHLEKAYEIERERFQELIVQAPSCMGALKGKEHTYVSANNRYLQLIGRQNIIGKMVKDVLPEIAEQGFLDLLDNVFETGETFTGNEMLIKLDPDGNGIFVEKYLNFIYQAHKNESGVIDGIFFFANDVTEQVLSRKEIEQSEKKYRQIVETAQEGIWLIDEHNKTTFVNSKMCEILGYKPEEMMGKEIYDFMDDAGKEIAIKLMQRKKLGEYGQKKFRYISKAGKNVWTSLSSNPVFNDDGSYRGALAMVTDITDRRLIEMRLAHSEAGLREAQTIARLGNWEIDLTGGNHFWSEEMYNILGLKAGEIAPSIKSLLSLVPLEDKQLLEQKMLEAVKNKLESVLHFRVKRMNGEVRHVQAKWRFQFDKCNNPTHVLGIMQDVTTLKVSELERTKMVKDLIQRNKDLEQFNYIVSHNLRAPVANIIGFADALRDSTYPESLRKEFLSQLTVSVSKLDQVIRDINGVLLMKQKVNDVKEVLSFSSIVKNIEISIQNLVQQYGVSIQSDFSEIDEILSIKSFLHSILYNLISNSIKYRTPELPPVISIRSHKTIDGVQLIFNDNSMGIDMQKHRESLFGLYKRFHLNIEGKGLGLFMTKSQIETLGGTIEAMSEVNRGITFKIYLPL